MSRRSFICLSLRLRQLNCSARHCFKGISTVYVPKSAGFFYRTTAGNQAYLQSCYSFNFSPSFNRYELMNECWREDPATRPSFSELIGRVETVMTTNVPYCDLSKHDESNPYYSAVDASSETSV